MRIDDRAFTDLAPTELYAILQLRSEVFVVEQNCVYLDLDGRDTDTGTRHVWVGGGEPVAYLRLLDDGTERRIGRVVTHAEHRGAGHAATLLEHVFAASAGPWVIDAQCHLESWYESFGFVSRGEAYDDDGILHVPMVRA